MINNMNWRIVKDDKLTHFLTKYNDNENFVKGENNCGV